MSAEEAATWAKLVKEREDWIRSALRLLISDLASRAFCFSTCGELGYADDEIAECIKQGLALLPPCAHCDHRETHQPYCANEQCVCAETYP